MTALISHSMIQCGEPYMCNSSDAKPTLGKVSIPREKKEKMRFGKAEPNGEKFRRNTVSVML